MSQGWTYVFPRMGNSYIGFKAFFDVVGKEVIIPKPMNKRILELGVKYAPEGMCFPFKVLLGQFIDILESYKDRKFKLVSLGQYGPCRFGYYTVLHEKILKELGYKNFEMLTLDGSLAHPLPLGIWRELKAIAQLLGFNPPWKLMQGFVNAGYKLYFTELVEKRAYHIMARELTEGEGEKAFEKALKILYNAPSNSLKAIKSAYKKAMDTLNNVECDENKETLKIGLIGEAYIIMDHDNNLNVEKKLANLGVDTDRSLRVTNWAYDRVMHRKEHKKRMSKINENYLGYFIGGDGQESIMNTILYKENGFDGVIQLLPFGCLPETVAKQVLTSVSHDYDMPVLSLTFDEQTGEAGIVTRLEAFVDLLWQRKRGGKVRASVLSNKKEEVPV